MILRGKCSWFGGPQDTGVASDEDLAFIYAIEDAPHLFLPTQPSGTTGLARRLDPDVFYIACRWDYAQFPKPSLLDHMALVRAPKTGLEYLAYPADWGPNETTGRVADISEGLMDALGIETDDEIEVTYPYAEQIAVKLMPYERIVISSGHGKYVRGASCPPPGLDEVDEARKVVDRVASELVARGADVKTYHDNVSKNQNENLNRIVDFHNAQVRDLDVSVHFNAYQKTSKPMGTEVLYVTQSSLAFNVSAAIASCGFLNRGPKKRTDLFFLNNTAVHAILIEVCFVDSEADANLYRQQFYAICAAIADVLGGEEQAVPEPEPPPVEVAAARVDIQTTGDVVVTVNGKTVT